MTPVVAPASTTHRTEDALDVLSRRLATASGPEEDHELREQLVLAALGLADAVARRYRDRGVELQDLEQVARLALVAATRRYDPTTGHGFAAFAVPSVSGEVKRYFRDHTWTVRPPRRLQELHLELVGAEERLRQELGAEPSPADVAEALGITREELREVRRSGSAYRAGSLDAPTPSGRTLGEQVADVADACAVVDTRHALRAALVRLSPRERRLVHLRFDRELTQREIGRELGVSQMQVSRLLTALVARLRRDVLLEAG